MKNVGMIFDKIEDLDFVGPLEVMLPMRFLRISLATSVRLVSGFAVTTFRTITSLTL